MLSPEIITWIQSVTSGAYSLNQITGRSNSKIFKLINNNKVYALKIYPSRTLDKRDRLSVEFDSLDFLNSNGIKNVPKNFKKSSELNIALYEWIEGSMSSKVKGTEVTDALNFIKHLKHLSRSKLNLPKQLASESCLSVKELLRQIDKRFAKLNNLKNEPDLKNFLNNDFKPLFDELNSKIISNWNFSWHYDNNLAKKLQLLSPSDFGFHNAIHSKDNGIIYIDFEYFGWDDPVKLTSDFIWHAGMDIESESKAVWLKGMQNIFSDDINFNSRFKLCHPLFGLRWCMILLNEFLPNVWMVRKHANSKKNKHYQEIKELQLNKAISYFIKVKEIVYEIK